MSISRHQATGAYQRWTPPDFDAPEQEAAPVVVEAPAAPPPPEPVARTEPPPEPTPEPLLEPTPKPQPEPPPEPEIKLPTAEEIEAMFEQARSEGYQTGQKEGLAAAHEEAARLARVVQAMDESLDRLGADVADEVAALAIALAERIVGDTLEHRPESVAATVREALQHAPQGKVRVHLHPRDVELVRQHLGDQLEAGHHHLIEDSALTRGGCHLETSGCSIDATLETRWQRVLDGLGRTSGDGDA